MTNGAFPKWLTKLPPGVPGVVSVHVVVSGLGMLNVPVIPEIPGADRFIQALQDAGRRFLILTNNSLYTPRDLAAQAQSHFSSHRQITE